MNEPIEEQGEVNSRYHENYPKEWCDALDALYEQYSSDPTVKQRYKILEGALGLTPGSYSISSTSDWRTPQEEIDLRNMQVQEQEYLEQIGLLTPDYC